MQFCKNCGSPFEGQFCGRCGTPVGQAPGHPAAPPPPPPPPSYAAPPPPPPPPPSYAAPPPPPPPPPSYGPPPPPAFGQQTPPTQGFWASLFDLSFTSFVAPKIIKFLYVLFMILICLGTLGLIYMGLSAGSTGLIIVLLAPVGAFLYLLLARMWLEVMIVLFRIAENTADIARNSRR